jgi:hypothetical protein
VKKLCALFSFGAAVFLANGVANAKMIANPDANTLWAEDGKDVEVGTGSSADHWSGELGVASSPEGFVLSGTDAKKFSTGRYVAVDSAYPWLSFEVGKTQNVGQIDGYHGFTLSLVGPPHFLVNPVPAIPTGIYNFNILRDQPAVTGIRFLRMDLYNTQLTFPSFKMVKVPDNYIEVSGPVFAEKKRADQGDEITFTVNLKESAEDVSLTFFDSYTMPQLKLNGENKLQLKPTGDDQKVWAATVKLDSIAGAALKAGEPFEPNRMLIKATVLGGAVKVPIWTGNPYPLHIKPAAK